MKKKLYILIALIALMVVSNYSYIAIGKFNIRNKMNDYIKERELGAGNLRIIEINHSWAAKILAYGEWSIIAKQPDKPNTLFFYTMRNGKVFETGTKEIPEDELARSTYPEKYKK